MFIVFIDTYNLGYNARKVISEVYASFVLQCTVSGIHLSYKKSMKYSSLQIPLRENWFQYVRRVYETAINFPYISTLQGRN